jgi:hypothetical protein
MSDYTHIGVQSNCTPNQSGPFLKHNAKAQRFIAVGGQHATAVRHMHRQRFID